MTTNHSRLIALFSAILAAAAVWRSEVLPRWSGVPFALAFTLYIPQFFGPPAIRVAHGLLVTTGCLWLAFVVWRAGEPRGAVPAARRRSRRSVCVNS